MMMYIGHQSGDQAWQGTVAMVTALCWIFRYGVRAPIPQTRGVLVEENTPPSELHISYFCMVRELLISYTGRALRSRRLPQSVFDPFQDYSGAFY